jgi:hypothetical protein
VDALVSDVVSELDPAFPTPTLNRCSAGKKKCVIKKVAALLKCYERAANTGTNVDQACLQKARAKFDGGADPSTECFAKLEAKGGCLTTGDATPIENKVDAFVTDVVCELGHSASCPVACGLAPYPQCDGACPNPSFPFCVAMGGPNCLCRDITPSPPPATPTPTPTPTPTVGHDPNCFFDGAECQGGCSTSTRCLYDPNQNACICPPVFDLECNQFAMGACGGHLCYGPGQTCVVGPQPSAGSACHCVNPTPEPTP